MPGLVWALSDYSCLVAQCLGALVAVAAAVTWLVNQRRVSVDVSRLALRWRRRIRQGFENRVFGVPRQFYGLGGFIRGEIRQVGGVTRIDSVICQNKDSLQRCGEGFFPLRDKLQKLAQVVSFWKFDLMPDKESLQKLFGSLLRVESNRAEVRYTIRK